MNTMSPESTGTSSTLRRGQSISLSTQTEIIKLYSNGMNKSQIAKELGVTFDTVSKYVKRIPKPVSTDLTHTPHDNVTIEMQRVGLTRERVTRALARALDATDTRLATWEGKFTDRLDVPDNAARNKAIELAAKILGLFPEESSNNVQQLLVRLPDSKVDMEQWNRSIETITVLPGEPVTLANNTSSNESTSTTVSDEGTKDTGSPVSTESTITDESTSTTVP